LIWLLGLLSAHAGSALLTVPPAVDVPTRALATPLPAASATASSGTTVGLHVLLIRELLVLVDTTRPTRGRS
jgi:hypothetical protein